VEALVPPQHVSDHRRFRAAYQEKPEVGLMGLGRDLSGRRDGAPGKKLAYVYFEDEPGRQSAAKLLSKNEARRIAANIAKLPDLLLGFESRGRA
jgi:hypothetical protein